MRFTPAQDFSASTNDYRHFHTLRPFHRCLAVEAVSPVTDAWQDVRGRPGKVAVAAELRQGQGR